MPPGETPVTDSYPEIAELSRCVRSLVDALARQEERYRLLQRRQRRIGLGILAAAITLVSFLTFAQMHALGPGLMSMSPAASLSPQERAELRASLMARVDPRTRARIADFERQVRFLSQYMQTWERFDAPAAVALFLSRMAESMEAMPGMYDEMRIMNRRMDAMPVMAGEMREMNAKMGAMASGIDSTMGRAGRAMPWSPYFP
jgi:hypothetical protein